MNLRKLLPKDADGMLSWMSDPTINKFFLIDENNINKKSIIEFIEKSQDVSSNLHLAITDSKDNYLGTISLKNINQKDRKAEYAISTCKEIHGTGISKSATIEILRIGFEELLLNKIYLNVLSNNERAVKFYEKCNFVFEGEFKEHYLVNGIYQDLKWYRILKSEFINNTNKY